ncbi:UDP-glucose 4-epimerase GalE [Heyndrickxia sporothermodurans]|uniref:UDP-glucose 4-epimerase GalE n=1 Tax=Heyndrickxia TaxID=2837504 RepID=UPI000D3A282D|nr:UDP-glucose 4-epimerase GalE [Heyndrickxia sporothermodurans]PTY78258.1 UDP-glucose 4-epimerase GalE [Heyndrickxia sporothermodurans]
MAILVTGGAGYIGSHTCIELLQAGEEIIVADNFSNSNIEALFRVKKITKKAFNIYKVDLKNREEIQKIFNENSIEAVIHFASLKSTNESIAISLEYYKNNIIGTLNLLDIMKNHHVKRIVFSSSAAVYGIPETVPIAETAATKPINPYGRTKLMIEEILRDLYNSDKEWSITILRYFNPNGAHKSGLIGEDPNDIPTNLMPYISKVAVGQLNELKIYGNDYPTIDGTGIRDYIHVEDLANGHLKALNKTKVTTGVATYNLGTGKGYSVFQMVKAFENAAQRTIPYKIVGRRQGDTAISYANSSKAEKELNWVAKKGIDDICEDTWRWQKNNPYGYKSTK